MLDGSETHYVKKTRGMKRFFVRMIPVVLSVSVAIATAYALIVPGLTMNKDTVILTEEMTLASVSDGSVETIITESIPMTDPSGEGTIPSGTTGSEETVQSGDESQPSAQGSSVSEETTETSAQETTSKDVTETIVPDDTAESSDATAPSESEGQESAPGETTEAVSVPSETSAETTLPTETSAQPVEYVFENTNIIVTARLDPQVVLPEGATFCVTEILQQTDPEKFADFVELLSENSEQAEPQGFVNLVDLFSESSAQFEPSVPAGLGIHAYDIGFFVGEDEVEPSGGSVSVTISYKTDSIEAETPADVSVFHVDETGPEMALEPVVVKDPVISEEGIVEEVTFEAQSFSPYLVTNGYTISSSLHYELIDNTAETLTNTSYYNSTSALDVAGSFHIVAFDTLRLDAHTNGNFCAKNLYAETNFGTNSYGAELSYVQNYLKVTSTDAADPLDVLVVGSSNTVSLVDNGNYFAVNGVKIDKPNTIWQDNDTSTMPFADLVAMRTGIKRVSAELAMQPNMNLENHLTTSGDPYQSYLQLVNVNSPAVINMTSGKLETYANGFSIRGFTNTTPGTVILNIDCSGDANVTVPKILMQVGSEMLNFKELTSFSSGKIVLNFINSANANIDLNLTYATVLAPDANILASQNVNGTIIGNNVTIKAESHRTDFTGVLPPPITGSATAVKSWKAFDGTTLTGSAISDMSVQVQLYCNGTAMTGSQYLVTLNTANSWTCKWSNLPIASGQVYTIKEVSISKNGTVIQTGDAPQLYEVNYTNGGTARDVVVGISNRVITGSVSVQKQWLSLSGRVLTAEEIKDLSVLVQLYQNGIAMTGSAYQATLSPLNSWTYEWANLPIGSGQKYTVREVSISRTTDGVTEVIQAGSLPALYAVTYNNNAGITNGRIDVINTVNTGTITVEKTWYDRTGFPMTPEEIQNRSVTVQLFCNGTAMTDPKYTIELSTANGWTHTWTQLPADTGQTYTIVESNYGGFTVKYENNAGINDGTILVKNSSGHENVLPDTGSIGTTGFYLTGVSLVLVSFLLVMTRKLRHRMRRGALSG